MYNQKIITIIIVPYCLLQSSWQAFDDEIRAMSVFNKWSTWTGASEWTPTKVGLAPRFLWKVN